ncbi:hypothetical protein PS925_02539 [Pseudomonas fluorescens]|uniref:Uncharacterized protein n=1 Tax=Pseudomonas fluorescens TaxID=294 RepID=A0A5E7U0N3_PSEFL|nr:hypothetical protein PS925_02539 [Pseudomonas fluorescens]
MTQLAIQICDSEDQAKTQADFYHQAGCKVEPIFSVRTVSVIAPSGDIEVFGDQDGDDRVWVVQVYK